MNFKKPTKKTFTDAATLTVGAVGGAALSRVVFGELPIAETPNETNWPKYGARVGFIVLGAVGAASVSGTDLGSKGVQGAFAGMAIQQGIELIADVAKANPSTAALANGDTKADVVKARALGLNCACDGGYAPGMGRPSKRALRSAVIDMSQYGSEQQLNSFETKYLDAKRYA